MNENLAIFTLRVAAKNGPAGIRSLRFLLKSLLRQYDMRALDIREEQEPEKIAVRKDTSVLDDIKQLIAEAGFTPNDFFLTRLPPPSRADKGAYTRWHARERRRRAIAQSMARCGLTAHDLVELPAAVGADSGEKSPSAEQEGEMPDMTKYAGAAYLGTDDVKEGPIRGTIAAVEVNKKIDRPSLIFTNGLKFTLNATNTRTLLQAFGPESDDWIGETVELTFDQVEYKEKMVDTVVLSVVPRAPGVEKVKPPKPKSAKRDDLNDVVPF